jgi:hypothetical protein
LYQRIHYFQKLLMNPTFLLYQMFHWYQRLLGNRCFQKSLKSLTFLALLIQWHLFLTFQKYRLFLLQTFPKFPTFPALLIQ